MALFYCLLCSFIHYQPAQQVCRLNAVHRPSSLVHRLFTSMARSVLICFSVSNAVLHCVNPRYPCLSSCPSVFCPPLSVFRTQSSVICHRSSVLRPLWQKIIRVNPRNPCRSSCPSVFKSVFFRVQLASCVPEIYGPDKSQLQKCRRFKKCAFFANFC
jgi:hypothetical protein